MNIETKNYRDTVFRLLFNDKSRLLELYNAVNGTNYNNPEELIITTLKGNTYLNMKNDVSCIIDFDLNLFEHQSTLFPNIPLRDLYYLASIMMELIPLKKTYRETPVEIPSPRFFVFYNGTNQMEDKVTLKLSDLFKKKDPNPSVELVVTGYNINYGHNKELMEACKTLKHYSIFVSKVRKYMQEFKPVSNQDQAYMPLLIDEESATQKIIRDSVSRAIDECIEEGVLRDFFLAYREEVISVSILEYTAEGHIQEIADENYEKGVEDGLKQGIEQGIEQGIADRDTQKITEMLKKGKTPEAISDFCGYPLEQVLAVKKSLE